MLWFAIPLGLYAAKKLYDVVSEDSSSSSSPSPASTYSDNSAQQARAARKAEQVQAQRMRAQRLHEQSELMVHRELKSIQQQFLQHTTLSTRFSIQVLRTFTDEHEVSNQATAQAALSALCQRSVTMQKLPSQQISIQAQIDELNHLEHLLKGL